MEQLMSLIKILVVDDSPTQLKMITSSLQNLDCEVDTAMNGEEALEKIHANRPDLVVLDVVMPKMDGFQVCRKMKASSEVRHIPVIMLSSKNQKADAFWGKKQGAATYLTKPYEESVLLDAITENLV
jgi:CheY-like chemotaxis protein